MSLRIFFAQFLVIHVFCGSNPVNVVILNDLSMSFEGSVDDCNLHQEMVVDTLQTVIKSVNTSNGSVDALRVAYIEFGHSRDSMIDGDDDVHVIIPITHHNDTDIRHYASMLPKLCNDVVSKDKVCDEDRVNLYDAMHEGFNQIKAVTDDEERVHFVVFSNCKPAQAEQERICNGMYGSIAMRMPFDFTASVVATGPDFTEFAESGAEYIACLVRFNLEHIHASENREISQPDSVSRESFRRHIRRLVDGLPPTPVPTTDPTSDPTTDPSSDPTSDPSSDPTTDPSSDPTTDPTTDPTRNPSGNPITFKVTVMKPPSPNPTTDPTRDPTSSPIRISDAGCTAKGANLQSYHDCQCVSQSECSSTNRYCKSMDFVARVLREPLGGNPLCEGDAVCCCHCPVCPSI